MIPLQQYFPIAQVIVSIFLIISILLQQRGTGLGSSFGSGDSFYGTRRGIQQKIFIATIILGALFIVLSLLNLSI